MSPIRIGQRHWADAGGALPRANRKLALKIADLPVAKLRRLADARMDGEYAGLDALMDD